MATPASYSERIELLSAFRTAILRWFNGEYEPEGKEALRSYINRNTKAAQSAVRDAGCAITITAGPPPAVGGLIIQNADPFNMLFQSLWGRSVIPGVADACDQAIGVYEHLDGDTGLVSLPSREVIDIASAIERALRPAFRAGPPESERQVQDEVETLLNALGVRFNREQDSAPIGARAFKPDFTFADLNLALEVKLARQGHREGAIQEELAADIAAYGTRWRHTVFVIYDVGVITDPDRLRRENMRLFGITVIVVKH